MINKLNQKPQGFAHYYEKDGAFSPRKRVKIEQEITPGIYQLSVDQMGNIFFFPQAATSDQLVTLPNTVTDKVTKEVIQFWQDDTKKKFDEYGLVHKRGILLYGSPGTGKTCTIIKVMENLVKAGGVVLFNPDPNLLQHAIPQIREIQPDLKILVIFEEFDRLVNRPDFLSLLDGESQVDNIVYIATTNYIQRIPDRIKNRPSRFASVLEIGAPNADARLVYLTAKLKNITEKELKYWVKITNGMVIDQMKDLIVSVCCFGLSLKEAADKINKMGYMADANTEGKPVATLDDEDYDDDEDDQDKFDMSAEVAKSAG